MARNAEKAQSMLFRFREAQAADLGIIDAGRTRRPRAVADQDSVPQCERWRGQVLRDISRKVSRIQEAQLTDYEVRDLNDEINRLFREKHAWEVQIRNLGGPNYLRGAHKVFDAQGREVPGTGGGGRVYKYFGRARELPGVRELFDAAARARKGAARGDDVPLEARGERLRRQVDAAYYGFAPDDEDEGLLAYEAQKENEALEALARSGKAAGVPGDWEPLPGDRGDGRPWVLPTMEQVQQELLDRKRRRLLDQL